MEPLEVDVDSFLLSKEIEIKEREANLLRIVMQCRKLGIHIPAGLCTSKEAFQPNGMAVMAPHSTRAIEKELASSESSKCGDADELVEPRIEDFGLSEEYIQAAVQMPICQMRNFKPAKSFQRFQPKSCRLDSSESIDGSPLSLRTVPFVKISGNNPSFDCTPEVCQMKKMSKAQGRRQESQYHASPNITPRCNALYEPQRYTPGDQTHRDKRQSLISPEEPELTCTMNQFKTFVIKENNNGLLANCHVSSASSSQSPDVPEFVTSTKYEDVSLSDLQQPQSPQICLDWLKSDLNCGSYLF